MLGRVVLMCTIVGWYVVLLGCVVRVVNVWCVPGVCAVVCWCVCVGVCVSVCVRVGVCGCVVHRSILWRRAALCGVLYQCVFYVVCINVWCCVMWLCYDQYGASLWLL